MSKPTKDVLDMADKINNMSRDELIRLVAIFIGEFNQALMRADSLQAKLEVAKISLEFYADVNNWHSSGSGSALNWIDKVADDTDRFDKEFGKPDMIGGKRAREALQKLKE